MKTKTIDNAMLYLIQPMNFGSIWKNKDMKEQLSSRIQVSLKQLQV